MTLREIASSRWAASEGLPFSLGATRIEEERAYNFALYSKHVQSVTLLYRERHRHPVLSYRFDYLKNKSGRIWHCRIPLASMQSASLRNGGHHNQPPVNPARRNPPAMYGQPRINCHTNPVR
jgi:pullulanase/glycogen debranching enzyme